MKIAYEQGKAARDGQASKLANPYTTYGAMWAWWLAGWNDRDMEIA